MEFVKLYHIYIDLSILLFQNTKQRFLVAVILEWSAISHSVILEWSASGMIESLSSQPRVIARLFYINIPSAQTFTPRGLTYRFIL